MAHVLTRAFVVGAGAAIAAHAVAGNETLAVLEEHTRALVQHARAGTWTSAAENARRLDAEVAKRAPLEIVDIQALSAPPQGLGMYTPLFKGEVRGEEVYLYAQVRNHGLREVHGFYELHLVSELAILDARGNELAKDEAFGESRFSARTPHRDTFVVIALRAKGLGQGTYVARLTLHDRVANKRASGEVKLVVP